MSSPAFFAACSIAAHPPRTMRSASETLVPPPCEPLKSCWIPSRACTTRATSGRSLTSQSFCGASRMRAPFAPPRLSVLRKLAADAHAVAASWETVSPEARIRPFSAAMSPAETSSWSTAGTGSCHSCGAGIHGPRYREIGPMSRCSSLYQALANASASLSGFSWKLFEIGA